MKWLSSALAACSAVISPPRVFHLLDLLLPNDACLSCQEVRHPHQAHVIAIPECICYNGSDCIAVLCWPDIADLRSVREQLAQKAERIPR